MIAWFAIIAIRLARGCCATVWPACPTGGKRTWRGLHAALGALAVGSVCPCAWRGTSATASSMQVYWYALAALTLSSLVVVHSVAGSFLPARSLAAVSNIEKGRGLWELTFHSRRRRPFPTRLGGHRQFVLARHRAAPPTLFDTRSRSHRAAAARSARSSRRRAIIRTASATSAPGYRSPGSTAPRRSLPTTRGRATLLRRAGSRSHRHGTLAAIRPRRCVADPRHRRCRPADRSRAREIERSARISTEVCSCSTIRRRMGRRERHRPDAALLTRALDG